MYTTICDIGKKLCNGMSIVIFNKNKLILLMINSIMLNAFSRSKFV